MIEAHQRLLQKLAAAWEATPHLSFGQLIESVDNVVWDAVPQRHVSARLMHIADPLFEAALEQWTNQPASRKPLYT